MEREYIMELLKGIVAPVLVLGMGLVVSWGYKAVISVVRPPPPKICGSLEGPPITAPRVKLRDGRYLAYEEFGVPKQQANYNIIFIHGFSSSRHGPSILSTDLSPPDIIEELGVHIVGFDKPGYGESDPDPNQTVKSLALDIEELADHLGLGSKFYVLGNSMGGQAVWGCLKYIPNRLAGAGLIAPVINYRWPSFPAKLWKECYSRQPKEDQWALRVAYYIPWLTYWWNTQTWFPSSTVISGNPINISAQDHQILNNSLSKMTPEKEKHKQQVAQQGQFESFHRAMMVGFGKWEFDPMDLKNPFPNNEGRVHLWQGEEDKLVPLELQRYIVDKLPWIHYHELPGAGHFFINAHGMGQAILNQFLIHN
ncbi:uncharacterized protein LOC115723426 [Cannabis sativa]|uniref:uncharacterized protein LOC115723426 n=1 Tax=Cannabis sativa TaxID=3483 RepID=UPI0029CA0856|nr:uncharacterized protein LOC115723426 [Cannabis sativa]